MFMNNEKSHLAVNIIKRRKKMGFSTPKRFAEAVNIPLGTIRDIETGRSPGSVTTLQRLARFFSCEDWELLAPPDMDLEAAKNKALTANKFEIRTDHRLAIINIIHHLSDQDLEIYRQIGERLPSYSPPGDSNPLKKD